MNGNGDYSELIEYLDGKFQKIDNRFEKVDKDISDMKDDISGLAMREELYLVKKELEDKIDDKFNQVMNTLDRISKLMETYHQEQIALGAKV